MALIGFGSKVEKKTRVGITVIATPINDIRLTTDETMAESFIGNWLANPKTILGERRE